MKAASSPPAIRRLRPVRQSPDEMQIQRLLAVLEVPDSHRYNRGVGGFWKADENRLLDVLDAAKRCYRESVKRHHPDRAGANDRIAHVTRAWKRVKQLFARRGLSCDR